MSTRLPILAALALLAGYAAQLETLINRSTP